jgi:hypothetical protein
VPISTFIYSELAIRQLLAAASMHSELKVLENAVALGIGRYIRVMGVKLLTLRELIITSSVIARYSLSLTCPWMPALWHRFPASVQVQWRVLLLQLLPLQDQAPRRLDPLLRLPSPDHGAVGILVNFTIDPAKFDPCIENVIPRLGHVQCIQKYYFRNYCSILAQKYYYCNTLYCIKFQI